MRGRWMIWVGLAIAIAAVTIAIAIPSSRVPDCPPPGSGFRCAYTTDFQAWARFGIAVVGILPVLLLISYQRKGGPWVSGTIWVLGTAGAVLLALRQGPVPASGGDCLVYPRCVTTGRPYLVLAWVLFLGATAMAIWLWDKDYPRKPRESSSGVPSSQLA